MTILTRRELLVMAGAVAAGARRLTQSFTRQVHVPYLYDGDTVTLEWSVTIA